MTYAPATHSAPPRIRLADRRARHQAPRPTRRARLWAWWSTPYDDAKVRRSGYALLMVAVAVLAFVAGVVWANTSGQDVVQLQDAAAVLL